MVEKAISGVSESKREMRTVRIKRKVTNSPQAVSVFQGEGRGLRVSLPNVPFARRSPTERMGGYD